VVPRGKVLGRSTRPRLANRGEVLPLEVGLSRRRGEGGGGRTSKRNVLRVKGSVGFAADEDTRMGAGGDRMIGESPVQTSGTGEGG